MCLVCPHFPACFCSDRAGVWSIGWCTVCADKTLGSAVASQQGPGFESWPEPFCVLFVCSLRVHVGFLRVLLFPPTILRHAGYAGLTLDTILRDFSHRSHCKIFPVLPQLRPALYHDSWFVDKTVPPLWVCDRLFLIFIVSAKSSMFNVIVSL